MPLIVLIDRDGIVRQVYEGRETPGADVVLAELRELLRE
jgi:peroxiredoxin